jgi:hypothetical protein
MMPSRGMGDIRASKMPKAKVGKRKDGDKFTQYKEGGKVAPKKKDFAQAAKTVSFKKVSCKRGW